MKFRIFNSFYLLFSAFFSWMFVREILGLWQASSVVAASHNIPSDAIGFNYFFYSCPWESWQLEALSVLFGPLTVFSIYLSMAPMRLCAVAPFSIILFPLGACARSIREDIAQRFVMLGRGYRLDAMHPNTMFGVLATLGFALIILPAALTVRKRLASVAIE